MFDLKNALERYTPLSAHEQQTKVRMLAFLDTYADCFERTLAIGHFTASSWLLNKDETHALLMHHAKLGMWVQLGGHCDGNKDVLEVAIKEAQEESGIQNIVPLSQEIFDIDIHLIPAKQSQTTQAAFKLGMKAKGLTQGFHDQEHYHYDVRFLLHVTGDKDIIKNRESKELRWISKDKKELPTESRSVVRMFDKWLLID